MNKRQKYIAKETIISDKFTTYQHPQLKVYVCRQAYQNKEFNENYHFKLK